MFSPSLFSLSLWAGVCLCRQSSLVVFCAKRWSHPERVFRVHSRRGVSVWGCDVCLFKHSRAFFFFALPCERARHHAGGLHACAHISGCDYHCAHRIASTPDGRCRCRRRAARAARVGVCGAAADCARAKHGSRPCRAAPVQPAGGVGCVRPRPTAACAGAPPARLRRPARHHRLRDAPPGGGAEAAQQDQ